MAISGISGSFSNSNQAASVQDRAKKLLEAMDSDGDGKVSKQEFSAMDEKMKARGPQGANAPAPPSAEKMFAKADKDSNGSLSVDDLSAMMAEHETHAAGRGKPPAGGPPPGGAPPGGTASGAGGAGGASSTASEKPDPADTNGDGNVSAAEKLIYELTQPNDE